MDINSCDFGFSDEYQGKNASDAWMVAREIGLKGVNAKQFMQGFIQCRQGMKRCFGSSLMYDYGYNRAQD